MSYLNINNLKLNKYTINLSLEKNTSYGVICLNQLEVNKEKVVNDFLLLASGINDNNNTCLLEDGTSIFDNSDYFSNRIYLDLNKKYLKTLNALMISDVIKSRFQKDFDIKKYKEAVSKTNIRSEVLVTDEYKFTDYGIILSSYCLLKGLHYKNIFVNNQTNLYRKEEVKKLVISDICNKNEYELMVIGVNNVFDYKDIIDRFLIFSDYNDVYNINPKTDTFILTDDSILMRNKIFKIGLMVISKNDYQKDELKQMAKMKQKYKILSFYEMIKFIGDTHEKA